MKYLQAWIAAGAALCMVRAEQVNLESYARNLDSIPIGIVKFRSINGPGISENKPWQIIADDLSFTGRFDVVKMNRLDSAAMAGKNAGLFIDGEYRHEGASIVLDCYLHDAVSMDLIFGKKYRGERKFLRQMAHRYSNRIVDMLLGEQGVFESKIIYVKEEGTSKNLFIMDYDGHTQKQLTHTSSVNVFPAFADANTVLWVSFLRGKPDIYRGSVSKGTSAIFLYSRYIETSPSVSRIDDRLAFASSRTGNLDIYLADADGTNVQRVTFNRGIDTSPCWSPNGYQIAFTSDRSGQPQIYIMDNDGANIRRLTYDGSYNDSPAWSPKGDRIAFTSLRNGKFDIWVIDPGGQNLRRVTSNPGNNEYPCWSPDGSHLVFNSTFSGISSLYVVRGDGSELRRLPVAGSAKMADWSHF